MLLYSNRLSPAGTDATVSYQRHRLREEEWGGCDRCLRHRSRKAPDVGRRFRWHYFSVRDPWLQGDRAPVVPAPADAARVVQRRLNTPHRLLRFRNGYRGCGRRSVACMIACLHRSAHRRSSLMDVRSSARSSYSSRAVNKTIDKPK